MLTPGPLSEYVTTGATEKLVLLASTCNANVVPGTALNVKLIELLEWFPRPAAAALPLAVMLADVN